MMMIKFTKTSIIFHRFPSETYCTQNLINSVKSFGPRSGLEPYTSL